MLKCRLITILLLLLATTKVYSADRSIANSLKPSYEPSNRDWTLLFDNKLGKFYAQKKPEIRSEQFTTVWIKLKYGHEGKTKIIQSNGNKFAKLSYTETDYSVSCNNGSVYFSHINWYDYNDKLIAEDNTDAPQLVDNALGRALVKHYCSSN